MKANNLITIFSAVVFTVGFISCKYDDSELWDEVRDHEDRIAQLESLCNQMNTNISSLQTIVAALQGNDYVTSITPVTSGVETIGYTINFSKSGPLTIYHGNDGKDGTNGTDGTNGQDGHTPIIGVKQTSDGNYYWTLDGNWLLDDDGNKIKANGTDGKDGVDGENGHDGNDGLDGKDGITPQLKIDEGYWYISYDNGNSWNQLGKATGEDGMDGQDGSDGKDGVDGDSMFSKVTYDDEFVYLILADNVTTLIIPRRSDDFDLQFADDNNLVCSSGETVSVSYTLTYGDENTEVAAIPHGGWEARVEKTSNTSGTITVTAPNPMKDGEVIVFASDGQGKTIMKKLVFEEGVVSIVTKSYVADSEQTTIEVELSTNLNYTVSIPDEAKSWISVLNIQTKATMRDDVVLLNIAANIGNSTRTANVLFVNSANEILNTVTISQRGTTIANNEIWYISSDGNIIEPDTYNFAGNIVSNTYGNGKGVIVFEEDLMEIWDSAFGQSKNLVQITIPDKVTSIGGSAFSNDGNLIDVIIPNGITSIGAYAFSNTSITKFTIPDGVSIISDNVFWGCGSLIDIIIPDGITSIGRSAFGYCHNLGKIVIPTSVTSIGSMAFEECSNLIEIVIPYGILSIEPMAFDSCSNLVEITIPESVISIGCNIFRDCNNLKSLYNRATAPQSIISVGGDIVLGLPKITQIYVPSESVEQYKSAEGWSQYASQIIGYDFTE